MVARTYILIQVEVEVTPDYSAHSHSQKIVASIFCLQERRLLTCADISLKSISRGHGCAGRRRSWQNLHRRAPSIACT